MKEEMRNEGRKMGEVSKEGMVAGNEGWMDN